MIFFNLKKYLNYFLYLKIFKNLKMEFFYFNFENFEFFIIISKIINLKKMFLI